VKDDIADTGIPVPHRHRQCTDDQFLTHMISDAPADHFP
jgi:hypothetical protein